MRIISKIIFTILILLSIVEKNQAQNTMLPNTIGINTSTPHASAALDISGTNKGLLIPRMTQVQRDAIVSPASGLMIFQTDVSVGFYYYNGTSWTNIGSGLPGTNGLKSLVKTTTESAGANCANGGTKVESGIDSNNNNILDSAEITETKYVCNGANGTNGTNGAAGTNGLKSLITTTSIGTPFCTNGGVQINSGLDANNNDLLDLGEISYTQNVCNGAIGTNGATGATGSAGAIGANGIKSLVKTIVEIAGANCANGGMKVETGLDGNGNNVLDVGEILNFSFVCNGTNGTNGLKSLVKTTVEAAGANCANGGTKVETGIDNNNNNVLDIGEVLDTKYVCNGTNGSNGTSGTNGTNGTNGINGLKALVKKTAEPAGANCAGGGVKIESGIDNNNNNTLDVAEVSTTQYVCNGINGQGIPTGGTANQVLSKIDGTNYNTQWVTPATTPKLAYMAILALPSPQTGDLVYDLTFKCLRAYNGSKWVATSVPDGDQSANPSVFGGTVGTNNEIVKDVAVDASGNVLVCGTFIGSVDFGQSTFLSSTSGSRDAFVAKYDPSGTLLWAKKIGGTVTDEAISIAVDASSNAFVCGWYTGTAAAGTFTFTAATGTDGFLVKYDSAGTEVWAKTINGTSSDEITDIIPTASGNIYVLGYYFGTCTFSASIIKTSTGGGEMFLATYDASGTPLSVNNTTGAGNEGPKNMALAPNGEIYICGFFNGTVTFGTTTRTSLGDNDGFVLRHNPTTNQWYGVIATGNQGSDSFERVVVDAASNAYIVGTIQPILPNFSFGSINMNIPYMSITTFIGKYRNSSAGFEWVKLVSNSAITQVGGLAIDNQSNLTVVGNFSSPSAIGTKYLIPFGTGNTYDVYVAKYSSEGNPLGATKFGSTGNDYATSIAFNAAGNIGYVVGHFNTSNLLVGSQTRAWTTSSTTTDTDGYIIRIDN